MAPEALNLYRISVKVRTGHGLIITPDLNKLNLFLIVLDGILFGY